MTCGLAFLQCTTPLAEVDAYANFRYIFGV